MQEIIGGVYKIVNLVNNKMYIGCTSNFKRRWREHKKMLNSGKHHSSYLQYSWGKYKQENFIFEILEEIKSEDIKVFLEREQYYLDFYKSYDRQNGYNIMKYAFACIPPSGINSKNSKLTLEQVEMIRKMYATGDYSIDFLSSEFGLANTSITKILHNITYKDKKFIPTTFDSLRFVNGKRRTLPRFTFVEVNKFRLEYNNSNISSTDLAEKYNISNSYASEILHNKIWVDENYIPNVRKSDIKCEKSPTAKLNWDIVREIKKLYAEGNFTQKELALKFDISIGTIERIMQGKAWVEKISIKKKERKNNKITEAQVKQIRKINKSENITCKQLSDIHGISTKQIYRILNNTSWPDSEYGEYLKEKINSGEIKKQKRKLNKEEVKRIRYNKNLTVENIMQKYDITISYVYAVLNNKYWPDPEYAQYLLEQQKSKDAP